MMRFKIMMCLLQLLSRMTNGTRSAFELLTQRHIGHTVYEYQMTTSSTTRADTCAASCARHPRCSIFKFNPNTSLCTIFVPDTFLQVSSGNLGDAERHYALTNGWCPVEYGYIFLKDVQMCIWLSSTQATQDSAVSQCGLQGGRLVVLADTHKWEAIQKLTINMGVYVYVGADDKAVDGTFVWNNGRLVNASMWHPHEPNGQLAENCVAVYRGLVDVPCFIKLTFICEILC
ncbi:brevican core protein-like [Haliotis rubra]|uniref:brevican core protein-like n=1 Tax=Haliotis rubra TaxID=36100 RepID=UPI001EE5F862|nr:brevican core protein-like [Haliotis rubra]